MTELKNGVYAILPTPFQASGAVDYDGIKNLIEYAIKCGAQGIVAMDAISEFHTLSDAERAETVEFIIRTANRRLPVIVGVSAVTTMKSVQWAAHAEKSGADMIIRVPPFFKAQSLARISAHYAALNETVTIPVILHNAPTAIGPAVDLNQQVEILAKNEKILYVREEPAAAQQVISTMRRLAEEKLPAGRLKGVIAGQYGYTIIHDYQRGARAFMLPCEMLDIMKDIYDCLSGGDMAGAVKLYDTIAPVQVFAETRPIHHTKGMLKRRGFIQCDYIRESSKPRFDEFNERECDTWTAYLKPYFKA